MQSDDGEEMHTTIANTSPDGVSWTSTSYPVPNVMSTGSFPGRASSTKRFPATQSVASPMRPCSGTSFRPDRGEHHHRPSHACQHSPGPARARARVPSDKRGARPGRCGGRSKANALPGLITWLLIAAGPRASCSQSSCTLPVERFSFSITPG
jgi:hypothetical protein